MRVCFLFNPFLLLLFTGRFMPLNFFTLQFNSASGTNLIFRIVFFSTIITYNYRARSTTRASSARVAVRVEPLAGIVALERAEERQGLRRERHDDDLGGVLECLGL